jgi:hypothetical protein
MLRIAGRKLIVSKEQLLSSPMLAIGLLDEVCNKLIEMRARFGIS